MSIPRIQDWLTPTLWKRRLRRSRTSQWRRLATESLEERCLLTTVILNPVADGIVADRNLDGAFETAVVSGSSISDRWFTDSSIGQERGIFEFDLSQVAAGTQISSARLRLSVNSFTSGAENPQFRLQGYAGDRVVSAADGASGATLLGTSTITALGVHEVTLDPVTLQAFLGTIAGIRLENTALSAQWFTVASLENPSAAPAQLVLETVAPPIFVSPLSGLTTTELGGTATFTVVLSAQPTADVSLALSSSDLSEGTVSASSLTFNSANWNVPQAVTVTGVSDPDMDGNVAYSIVTAPATSSDPVFNNFDAPNVSVTNLDHEWTQLTLSGGNLLITDIVSGGKHDTLTIQSDTTNSKFIVSDPNYSLIATGIPGAVVSPDQHVVEVPFSSVTGTQITVNTLGGNDSLTVDFSLGNFTRTIGYNGGVQSSSDSLTLVAGSFNTVTHTLTSDGAGTIDVTGNSQVVYTGLESATDSLIAVDRVFSFNGGAETITLSDAVGTNMTIDSTIGAAVTFANPTGSMTINAGTGNDTVAVPSVDANGPYNASLTINGDAGSDTVSLGADITFAAGKNLDVDLQNDAAAGDADRVVVSSNANVRASGAGTITVKASRDVFLAGGSSLEVVNGDLIVAANQQATPTTGAFQGVNINGGLLRSTGTGNVTVLGRGGNDPTTSTHIGVFVQAGGAVESTSNVAGAGTITVVGTGGAGTIINYGVRVFRPDSRITSAVGDIQITGTGGAGTGNYNGGIIVDIGGEIRSWGTGTNAADVTLTGNGAQGTNLAVGVHVDSATITTVDGDIQLNGTGGSGSGNYNIGVDIFGTTGVVASTGTGTSAGTITINGTGGGGIDFNTGVFIDGGGRVRSVDGAVQLSGTAVDTTGPGNNGIHFETGGGLSTSGTATATLTGAAASLSSFGIALLNPSTITLTGATNAFIADRTSINASGAAINAASKSVAFRPKTSGVAINLGGEDGFGTLGLTDAELNRVTAGTIQIGDSSSGAITVIAPVAHATSSNFELTSGSSINFNSGSLSTGGGTLLLTPGPMASVQPNTSGVDVIASALSFGTSANLAIPINGTTVDAQYRQLKVTGLVNLTGVDLVLSGSYVPTASDSFLIVDNDGSDPVTGTFNGLAEGATVSVNGVSKKITYVGGTGNDVLLSSPPLTISIDAVSIAENGVATTATVSRTNSINNVPLTVSLASSDTSEATVPATVTIPANQSSVTFSISAVDDDLLDGTQTVLISAAASEYLGGSRSISVTDYETLTVSIATASIAENAGAAATMATVTRSNTDTSEALTVNLASSDTSEVTVPTSVVIPAGQIAASFTIDAVDDTVPDGAQAATIIASANGYVIGMGAIEVTDAPTISDLTDQTTDEDTPTAPIPFSAGDSTNLILIGSSSNTLLVPNANIVFNGSGASRTVTVTPAPNQSGTATITVTVSDNGTTTRDTFVLTVTAVNDTPVAGAGGPYTVAEGSKLVFDASASFDLEQPYTELTYAWDLDYDGASFDVDATEVSPSVVFADNFAARTIATRVTDSGGLSHIATTTLTVTNVAPSALVTGAAGGVSGQTRVFTLGAGDPSSVDQAANFTFNIDWGDNTTQVVTGPVGITVGHVYAVTGTYVVRVTATDKDGVASALSTGLSLSIVAAQTQGNDLVVGGTPGSEAFTFTPGAIAGTFTVKLGSSTLGTFNLGPSGFVNIFGQSGTDSVTINGNAVADTFRVTDINTIALNGIEVRSQGVEGWQFNGLGGTDTLVGPDLNNAWLLTAAGGGILNGSIQFATMENLTGGATADTFKINSGGALSGVVNGGGGTNVLDYSSITSAVVVNLANASATSLGGVANFTVVVGGSGNDTLTGGPAGSILLGGAGSDALQGGSGRDLLIGGSNADTLRGGAGEDLLFGGRTSYFNESTKELDLVSLDAIFQQWLRTDLNYATRISNLMSGGVGALVSSSKFTNDANAADDLFGEDGQDWYLISRKDRLNDKQSNETVTNI